MPYIDQSSRDFIDKEIEVLAKKLRITTGELQTNPGHLNYAIFRLCKLLLESDGISYTKLNTVMGVLTCVESEIYRRLAVPYEKEKMIENGDIE